MVQVCKMSNVRRHRIFNIKLAYCATLILSTAVGQGVPFWKSYGLFNEIVMPDPPYLDNTDRLVVRTYNKGSWFPNSYPMCVRAKPRRCSVIFEETSTHCRYITEPRTFDTECNIETIPQIENTADLNNELIWVPYRRSTKYGPFLSVTRGEDFGKPFTKPLKASLADPNFFNKHCIVGNSTSNEYFPEFCDKEHRHVCDFDKKEANSRCPDNCVSADVFTKKCYCKEKSLCPTRLSKLDTIFDLTILRDLLDDDDVCYVDSNLLSANKTQALSKDAWFYPNSSLNCSLCSTYIYKTATRQQHVQTEGETEMVLYFDETDGLFLTIYSPDYLDNAGNTKDIYCYTDAAQYEPTKRINIELILRRRQEPRSYNVYKITLEKYIGDYWCEAYKNDSLPSKVYSNTVLAYEIKTGNEFALSITIPICILLNCSSEYDFNYPKLLGNINLSDLKSELRVMEITRFDFNKSLDMLLHITTENKKTILEDYAELKTEVEGFPGIEIEFFKSSEYCLSERTNNMTWPLTRIGQTTLSKEICLQENGLPVIRICKGDFLRGSNWSDVVGECHKNMKLPNSTKYIQSILNKTVNNEIISKVTTLIKQDPNLPVSSIYMVSKFLEIMYHQLNTSKFHAFNSTLEIVDNLLNVNKDSLVNAQETLDVSDDILDVVDNILGKMTAQSKPLLFKKNNLMVHVTNPIMSNVSGLVVHEEGTVVKDLPRGSNFSDIGPNAKVAIVIPEEIIRNSSNMTIITTIFFKHTLFESNNSKKPSGPIISVSIPQFGFYLPSPIYILFYIANNTGITDKPECSFWDYGKRTTRQKGKWSTVGGNYKGKVDNDSFYHICAFFHLTHFSLLNVLMNIDLTVRDDTIMDVIFYVGDALNIIGITGIFMTAIMFQRWRKKKGTVILLNLSVAVLLEVFLMQITDTEVIFAQQGCDVVGILLHYIIISKFCWMLVSSFLQYLRFARVLSVLPEHIVLKSTIFGWGLAIIPVAIVNIMTRATYTKNKYNFCYPTGISLYLGTLLPIGIVIIINTFVFIAVMRKVTSVNIVSHGNKEIIHKFQVQLGILLFFVLGVPWLFFVFANFIPIDGIKIILAYLFCVTSNVQGFILFLFYVVFNTETRIFWVDQFSIKRRKISISTNTKLTTSLELNKS